MIDPGESVFIELARCNNCGKCLPACGFGAIRVIHYHDDDISISQAAPFTNQFLLPQIRYMDTSPTRCESWRFGIDYDRVFPYDRGSAPGSNKIDASTFYYLMGITFCAFLEGKLLIKYNQQYAR